MHEESPFSAVYPVSGILPGFRINAQIPIVLANDEVFRFVLDIEGRSMSSPLGPIDPEVHVRAILPDCKLLPAAGVCTKNISPIPWVPLLKTPADPR